MSDEELLQQFVGGDREALGTLAERHEPRMLGLARAIVGPSPGDSDDAVQQTWVRVIRFAAKYDNRASVRTWLYRILINECRGQSRVRRATQSLDAADEVAAPTAVSEGDREFRRAVETAVASLDIDKRAVVLLCYHADMTHEEAAAVLEIPQGTLKSRLSAALSQLRATLAEAKP
ncbi:MAG: RNA polymerase sigma factor [Phycisphaerae bacterium]